MALRLQESPQEDRSAGPSLGQGGSSAPREREGSWPGRAGRGLGIVQRVAARPGQAGRQCGLQRESGVTLRGPPEGCGQGGAQNPRWDLRAPPILTPNFGRPPLQLWHPGGPILRQPRGRGVQRTLPWAVHEGALGADQWYRDTVSRQPVLSLGDGLGLLKNEAEARPPHMRTGFWHTLCLRLAPVVGG